MMPVNQIDNNRISNPANNPVANPVRRGFQPSQPRPNPIQRLPFMPVYHKGTDYVEKTGPAMLEKGEKVIPKEENESTNRDEHMDALKDILGGHEPHKPAKELKHIVHRRTKNGGHIFEHHYTHPEHHKMDEHAFNDDKDAVKHFMTNATDLKPEDTSENTPETPQAVQTVPGV